MVSKCMSKRDLLVTVCCVVFLLVTMGSIGSGGKRRAKETVCRANLKRLGVFINMFANDNDGRTFEDGWDWYLYLEPYYMNNNFLLCPEATKTSEPVLDYDDVLGGKFSAWGREEDDKIYISSYGNNLYCSHDSGGGRTSDKLWFSFNVSGSSNVPLLLDGAYLGLTPLDNDVPPEYDGQIYEADGSDENEIRSFCLARHGFAVNSLFMDLGVRRVKLKELWILKWHRNWNLPPDPLPTAWDNPEHWMYKLADPY